MDSIGAIVKKMESDYIVGNTEISKYVTFDQYENLNTIDAYLNSKHVSGPKDSLGREKPFFNIVTAAVNIWYRATNIARNKIRIKAVEYSQYVHAFIGTIHIQEWMKREHFEEFLDRWGMTLARYGSALVKFVEKDGKLEPSVIPWNRIICDALEFEGNPCIENLEFTQAQLRNSGYDKEQVGALIDALTPRKTIGRQSKDNKSDYITLYEVHGELPLSFLTDQEDDKDTYVQQIHIISFASTKTDGEKTTFTLYKGREKNPYIMTHLIKEDNRTQGIGAVEHLFQAQWMTNHSMKLIKDQLDLASRLIFQTADSSFVGKNILKSIVSGDILVHNENQPLQSIANNAHDITALQNFASQWQILGQQITSTPDAVRGNTQPSGTPFRAIALENQEGNSLFEVMKRTKKRYLEEMMRKFVIPHVNKKMDTSEEIAATLESQDITKLDSLYVPNEAIRRDNEQIKKTVLSGVIAQNLDLKATQAQIQDELSQLGNQRFLKPSDISTKTWKEVLKGLEWEVEIDINDKETDDQLVLQSLIDWFKIIANPTVQQYMSTPQGKVISSRILEKTNAISPLELSSLPAPTPITQSQPLTSTQ